MIEVKVYAWGIRVLAMAATSLKILQGVALQGRWTAATIYFFSSNSFNKPSSAADSFLLS